jgi:hypothetical protein
VAKTRIGGEMKYKEAEDLLYNTKWKTEAK